MPSLDAPDQTCDVPKRGLLFEIANFKIIAQRDVVVETPDHRVANSLNQWMIENFAASVTLVTKKGRLEIRNAKVTAVSVGETGNVVFTLNSVT